MKKNNPYKSRVYRIQLSNQLAELEPLLIKQLGVVSSLQTKYDKSDTKLYSYDKMQLKVRIKNIRMKLSASKFTDKNMREYIQFINEAKLLATNPKQYIKQEVDNRIDTFLKGLKENVSEEESEYAKFLLDNMSRQQIIKFFTSDKYQKPVNNWESESWRNFFEDTGRSVEVAKLEDFINKHTKNRTNDTFNQFKENIEK